MAKFIIEIRSKGFTNAKQRIDETTISLKKQQKQSEHTRAAVKRLNRSNQGLISRLGVMRNQYLLLTFVVGGFIASLRKLTEVTRAATLEDLTRGFDSLRVNAGLGADTLQRLREATNGTVTDMELMRQANNAMLLGVARSTEELAQLFDAAQQLGRALGKDATSSIESLVTGLGRQSRLMLDNVGIMIKVNEAYEEFARVNNTTVAAMTDTEKKTAFLNSGLAQALEKIKAFGKETLSSSDKIRQTNVATQKLADTVSQALAPKFLSWSKDLKTVVSFLDDYIRANNESVFAGKKLEEKIHVLKSEITNLKLAQAGLLKETESLTDEEIKLQKKQENRVSTLKYAVLESGTLLGVEKEMLKAKLGLREAISLEEMALLNLIDTRSIDAQLQGKEVEFAKAQIAIKQRQARMIQDEETQAQIERLKALMKSLDELRAANIAWADGQLEIISMNEDEKRRLYLKSLEELTEMQAAELEMLEAAEAERVRVAKLAQEELDKLKDGTDGLGKSGTELEDQFRSTASAITTVSGALQVLTSKGASAEDKMKSLLTTIGALLMQGGGAGLPFGAALQAFAGFIGHTGGLIQNNGIQRFATGGMVQGQDNVPILAQSGEFIMQRSAVNSIGLQNLAQMNNTGEPSGGVTINIAGDMVGDEDHVRTKVLPAIKEELRREANA